MKKNKAKNALNVREDVQQNTADEHMEKQPAGDEPSDNSGDLPWMQEDELFDADEVNADIDDTIAQAEGGYLGEQGFLFGSNKPEKRHLDIIGSEQVKTALETLKKYKQQKKNFDDRVVDNEEWWKLRHWNRLKKDNDTVEPTSAWLFNSIMNKLADYSDNFPEPNIRARTQEDVPEAQRIKNVIPMILESNDYEATYMDTCLSKIKNGTSITGVFWNSSKDDIDIKPIDVLQIFWQPGVKDIQASRNVFTVELVDTDLLQEMYPDKEINSGDEVTTAKYLYEDSIDTSGKSAVIDWYYKKQGKLHYCKFVNETVLMSSENEPDDYPNGWYDDGEYPFVVDTLFKMEGTIAGFGYLDVCKSPQEYIDKLDKAIITNTLMSSVPRYFEKNGSSIDKTAFLDWNNPIVTTNGNLGEDDIRSIPVTPLGASVFNARDGKIQELKQTSGNSDVNTGTSANGVTAASAISQLIETGSKGSRHTIKGTYRAYKNIIYKVIERMRQFYDEPRYVRILGDDGSQTFDTYTNAGLKKQTYDGLFGESVSRLPMFDIEVSAQKSSPYNKMNQNELALQFYQYGFFSPQNTDMTLACLNMMDFDHKSDIIAQVQQNGTLYDALMQAQQENERLKQMVDMAYGSNLTGSPPNAPQQESSAGSGTVQSTQEDETGSAADKMRKKAADATQV